MKLKAFINNFGKYFKNEKTLPIYKNTVIWLVAPILILVIALSCGTAFELSGKYDGFFNIGIDFKGGTVLTVSMTGADLTGDNRANNLAIITEVCEEYGVSVSSDQNSGSSAIILKYANSVNGVDLNDKEEQMADVNNKICLRIQERFRETYGNGIAISANAESVGATASADSVRKAVLSIGIAMLVMLIYIIIRFDFFSGVATIIGLAHDVIIMIAGVVIFRIPINSTLIACIITIISYSLNNTIVIFDRMREKLKPFKNDKARLDVAGTVDMSVTECLTRSMFTTLTTLFVVVVLLFVGVQTLTEFCAPIVMGLLAALYSSIFVTPALWGHMVNARYVKKPFVTRDKSSVKQVVGKPAAAKKPVAKKPIAKKPVQNAKAKAKINK